MDEDDVAWSTSGLFSRPATLVALGIVAFIAASYSATALSAFAAATLVLMSTISAWGRLGLWRLDATLYSDGDRLFAGETYTLRAAITNRKVIPVWIRIRLELPAALVPAASSGADGETGLPPFGSASGSWTFIAGKRGLYRPGHATMVAGDLLGLCREGKKLPFERDIVVYPRLAPLADVDFPFQDYFGINSAKGIIEDPAFYEGTREYSGNKPAKSIHWKASARFNVLQEKIFEPTSHRKVFLVLDGAGFENVEYIDRFETALEILAALAARFAGTGSSFAIATDRRVSGFPPALPLGRGPEHLGRVLELLARCVNERGQALEPLVEDSAGAGGTGYIVVCSSPRESSRTRMNLPSVRMNRVQYIVAGDDGSDEPVDWPTVGFDDILRNARSET